MKKIVLPFVAVSMCLASAMAIRAISATTNSPIAALLSVNINTSSSVQTGDTGTKTPSQVRTLTFAERVTYQRAIEDVYWRHRIWPKENSSPKPSLDAVISRAELERKVQDYLRGSQALRPYSHRSITADQLQAEVDRMAQDTKQPEVLRELFEALGNDPFVIAECLALPTLAERLLANSYAYDQRIRGELKQDAKADLQAHNSIEQMNELGGKYTKIDFVKSEKARNRLMLAGDALQRQPLGSLLATAEDHAVATIADTSAKYTLPNVSGGATCTDDTWTATTTANAPSGRSFYTAVWTGSEMIVWGGRGGLNTGGRYNPSTDSWTATSLTNAPTARHIHTAVWTGSEMIVWGGSAVGASGGSNSGGRYNPSTDSWTATSTTDAPAARASHTAVWIGSEMIVWGGDNPGGVLNTGGRYNPSTDSWTATSTSNAPSARNTHTAVWTGNEMIVWGGSAVGASGGSNSGGRYNPSTDSWIATSTTNAPTGRWGHTAVWTGSEMIVWGGYNNPVGALNTGGRYNPSTDSWTATSTTNAPSSRYYHTAVWTASEMIVWGGYHRERVDTGGRYIPSTNSWTATSTINAPAGRAFHTAVWTGNEMIVWGGNAFGLGLTNTGGRYCATGLPAQLGNISTRAFVQTGDNVMIGGFIVQGTDPKRVIIRAIGPELGAPPYSIPNALVNPTLELHDSRGALIASNDNWQHTIIGGIITSDQRGDIRNSGYAPRDGRESAIVADLQAGNYTAIVRGVDNMTGVALVEVYDLSADNNSILANISTRSFVQTGDDVMIGGFIVQGTQPKRVIVRAIGPELTQHGVPDALADPTLELHDETGALIASNDSWLQTIIGGIITANQVQEIRSSGHAPTDSRESAIIADLPVGNYTAIVRGINNTTGVALVEVYDLD